MSKTSKNGRISVTSTYIVNLMVGLRLLRWWRNCCNHVAEQWKYHRRMSAIYWFVVCCIYCYFLEVFHKYIMDHQKKATKYVGKKRVSCILSRTPPTGNKGIHPHVSGRSSDQSTQLGQFSQLDLHYCGRSQKTTTPFSVDYEWKFCFCVGIMQGLWSRYSDGLRVIEPGFNSY
jgi:hypothetical protein